MLTDEQKRWLIPVFNKAYSILDKIPDLKSTCHSKGFRFDAFFTRESYESEFFYDEDDGLYKVTYMERDEYSQELYGKTNREIIRHIVDRCINEDAYLNYASQKFWELHPDSPLPCRPEDKYADQYDVFANERVFYCHSIVKPYIESIEMSTFPPNSENEPLTLLKKGVYLSLFLKSCKYIVKVSIPEFRKYCHYRLCIQGVEHGQICGLSFYLNQEKSTIDISKFCERTDFLSLEAELTPRYDRALLECLEINRNT